MRLAPRIGIGLVLLLLLVAPDALANERRRDVTALRVFPTRVNLDHQKDRQRVVVQAVLADGVTTDVTASARLAVDGKVARLKDGWLLPVTDGKATLTATYAGRTVEVPVQVRGAGQVRPVNFTNDVMPVLAKGGCNSGSCHGSARGKDGFHLSLFGYDPQGDYHRMTRQMSGRRVNLALPAESLMLRKATGMVRHTGGQRFGRDRDQYRTLLRWVEAGVPRDPAKNAALVAVELLPRSMVLEDTKSQQLLVRARYSDGTDRDVTGLAVFMSNNAHSASVSETGLVTAHRRGEAFIFVRYGAFTVASQVIVIPRDLKFTFPAEPESSYIDKLVNDKLRKLRIAPSGLCSDEVFLRRVYIDIIGKLPTQTERRRFLKDERKEKRRALVDELLGRKEFVELWVLKWADKLQIRTTNRVSYKAMYLYHSWLQKQIAGNVPMDKMVQALIGARGSTFTNPETNFYYIERDPQKLAENVAQVFMGMRIQCAQCHNHPFDRWTQDDYYGFTAFFRQIGRKRGGDPRETIVFNTFRGETRHPVGNRVVRPKLLGGPTPNTRGKDRRKVLAAWIASPQNPWFARNLSNIVWEHFFGMGIVHEIDDVRVSNPPSNPELLTELGRRFTTYRFDFKKLVRDICNSRAYQRTTRPNASNRDDKRNFARSQVRRIRAEVLLDCINQITGTAEKFRGLPRGARAVQIADGRYSTYFLTTFGRPKRETVCSCEVRMEPTLSQALHLLNGQTVTTNIERGNIIGRLLAQKKTPKEIVELLYVRCYSRRPKPQEWEALKPSILAAKNRKQILEDVLWALLNSREFIFNH